MDPLAGGPDPARGEGGEVDDVEAGGDGDGGVRAGEDGGAEGEDEAGELVVDEEGASVAAFGVGRVVFGEVGDGEAGEVEEADWEAGFGAAAGPVWVELFGSVILVDVDCVVGSGDFEGVALEDVGCELCMGAVGVPFAGTQKTADIW